MTLTDWLAARERLAGAATEGPWYANEVAKDGRTVVDDGRAAWANDMLCETSDAAFIADARESLPRLVEMVRVLSEALELEHSAKLTHSTAECPYCNALRRVEAIAAESEGG